MPRHVLLVTVVAVLLAGCSSSPSRPAAGRGSSPATGSAAPSPTAGATAAPTAFTAEYAQMCTHVPVGALPGTDEVSAVSAALGSVPGDLPSRTYTREECPGGSAEPGAVPVRVVFAGALSPADLSLAGQAVAGAVPGATAISGVEQGTGVSVEVPFDGPEVPPLTAEQTAVITGSFRIFSFDPARPGTARLRYVGPPVADTELARVAAVLETAAGAPAGSAVLRPWSGRG
jgi:hypothetical protein